VHPGRLILLVGPPACGKSTWRARYLATASRSTTVVSSDDVLERFAAENGWTYDEAWRSVDSKVVTRIVNEEFDAAVKRGDDIIVDRTNMTAKIRRSFMSRVPKQTRRIAVLFPIEREELDRRLESRARETGKYVPKSAVDEMYRIYVAPDPNDFDEIQTYIAQAA
jgi:tRNA uridine 5-carbamoylmethylation protein Kti12